MNPSLRIQRQPATRRPKRLLAALIAPVCLASAAHAEVDTETAGPTAEASPPRIVAQLVALPEPAATEEDPIKGTANPETALFDRSSGLDPEAVEIKIDNSLVELPDLQFALHKAQDGWDITLENTGAGASIALRPELTKAIGCLRFSDGDLMFRWAQGTFGREAYADQLMNSVVIAKTNSKVMAVCPRGSVQWSAAVVDLSKSIIRVELPIVPSVPLECLGLRIDRVESPGQRFYPEADSRTSEDPLRTVLVREDTIESTLDVRVVERGERLTLEIRASYRDPGGAKQPMVASKMVASIRQREKSLERMRSRAREAEKAIPELEKKLKDVSRRKPSNPQEHGEKIRAVRNLSGVLKKARSAVERAEQTMPDMRSGIEAMKVAVGIARSLHQKTKIELTLVARAKDVDVPLLMCASDGKD